MKDIQNEVKALEVALQLATDIQGKPYAYAVARIQQTLLGMTPTIDPLEPPPEPGDGHWHVSLVNLFDWWEIHFTKPLGDKGFLRLPTHADLVMAREFIESFNSTNRLVKKQWNAIFLDCGMVYLRNSYAEVPLGAYAKDSEQYKMLLELKHYIFSL